MSFIRKLGNTLLNKENFLVSSLFSASFIGDLVKTKTLGENSPIDVGHNNQIINQITFGEKTNPIIQSLIGEYGYGNATLIGFGAMLAMYASSTVALRYLSKKGKVPRIASYIPSFIGIYLHSAALLGDVILNSLYL